MVQQPPPKDTKETSLARTERAVLKSGDNQIIITFQDVKQFLCPKASDAEVGLFIKTCQSEGLNPFAHEISLVKYSEGQAAAIIVEIAAYLKAAEAHPQYDGHEAGVILKAKSGTEAFEFVAGSFIEEDRVIVGGWAKVFRKDRAKPIYAAVNITECQKMTREGKVTRFWDTMPATMVRKVALSRALREAFPKRLGATVTEAEFHEIPDGTVPGAFLDPEGTPEWPLFWARQKDKGLNSDDVHHLLGINSLKSDWLDMGKTLEDAENAINSALQQRALVSEAEPETERDKLWSAIKTLVGRTHPTTSSLINCWSAMKIEAVASDFQEPTPPAKFSDKDLKSFHDLLVNFETQRAAKK